MRYNHWWEIPIVSGGQEPPGERPNPAGLPPEDDPLVQQQLDRNDSPEKLRNKAMEAFREYFNRTVLARTRQLQVAKDMANQISGSRAIGKMIDALEARQPDLLAGFGQWYDNQSSKKGLHIAGPQTFLAANRNVIYNAIDPGNVYKSAAGADISIFNTVFDQILEEQAFFAQRRADRVKDLNDTIDGYTGGLDTLFQNTALFPDQKSRDLIDVARTRVKTIKGRLSDKYEQALTLDDTIDPMAFLDANLPRHLADAMIGTDIEVPNDSAFHAINGVVAAIRQQAKARVETQQGQATQRVAAASMDLERRFPNLGKTIQQSLGDVQALQQEASSLGIPLDKLLEQKVEKLTEAGNLDQQLEDSGVDREFRQRIASIRAQQGDIKTGVDVNLSELEKEHGAAMRQAGYEAEFARSGAINEATLRERDLQNQSRDALRNLDTETGDALSALAGEEEAAVRDAIAGTPPNRIRAEREQAVRKQFAIKAKVLSQQFDRRRKDLERGLDVQLRESDASIRAKLEQLGKTKFQRSEALQASFGQKATLLEKELVNRLRNLKEEEASAAKAKEFNKVIDLQAKQRDLVNSLVQQERKTLPPTVPTEGLQKRPATHNADGSLTDYGRAISVQTQTPPTTLTPPTPPASTEPISATALPSTAVSSLGLTSEQAALPIYREFPGAPTAPAVSPNFRPGITDSLGNPLSQPVVSASALVPPVVPATSNPEFGNDPFAQALLAAGVPNDRVKVLLGR